MHNKHVIIRDVELINIVYLFKYRQKAFFDVFSMYGRHHFHFDVISTYSKYARFIELNNTMA